MRSPAASLGVVMLAVAVQLGVADTQKPSPGHEVHFFTNGLALLNAEFASEFTNHFGDSISELRMAVLAPDFLTNILQELSSPAFTALVSEGPSAKKDVDSTEWLPRFRIFAYVDSLHQVRFSFVTDSKRSSPQFLRFKDRVKFYIHARSEGHTTNYIYAALRETETTNYFLPLGFPRQQKKIYRIPSAWIQRFEPDKSALLSQRFWLVVDGKFAWLYDSFGFPKRMDAQEFDPKLKSQFAAAKQEARALLEKRGIHEFDSTILLDREVQRILRQKFHIKWFTPEELVVPP